MVKVLDNQIIDLDILPGLKPAELMAKASAIESKSPEQADALRQLAAHRAASLADEVERKTAGVPLAAYSPESGGSENQAAGEQAQTEGGLVGNAKGVGFGLAETVGLLGKGVGDTLGNTVYALGSGIFNTGQGVAKGLAHTGQSAVGYGAQDGKGLADDTEMHSQVGRNSNEADVTTGKDERHPTDESCKGPNIGRFEPLPGEALDDRGQSAGAPNGGVEEHELGLQREAKTGRMEDMEDVPRLRRISTDSENEEKFQGVRLVEGRH